MGQVMGDIKGDRGIIGMNRPAHNALTIPFMQQMASIMREWSGMPVGQRPRVMMVTSRLEKMFCNGIDPDTFLPADQKEREDHFRSLLDLMTAALETPFPIITVVSGPAMAGGAVIAMLGDFVLMDRQSAKLSFSEAKVGVPIPTPIFKLCERKVCGVILGEMLLLGKNLDGVACLEAGLAQGLYDGESDQGAWLESLAGRMGRVHPEVWRVSLRNSRREVLQSLAQFEKDFDQDLAPFLTDDYLGKGLRAIQQSQQR